MNFFLGILLFVLYLSYVTPTAIGLLFVLTDMCAPRVERCPEKQNQLYIVQCRAEFVWDMV